MIPSSSTVPSNSLIPFSMRTCWSGLMPSFILIFSLTSSSESSGLTSISMRLPLCIWTPTFDYTGRVVSTHTKKKEHPPQVTRQGIHCEKGSQSLRWFLKHVCCSYHYGLAAIPNLHFQILLSLLFLVVMIGLQCFACGELIVRWSKDRRSSRLAAHDNYLLTMILLQPNKGGLYNWMRGDLIAVFY